MVLKQNKAEQIVFLNFKLEYTYRRLKNTSRLINSFYRTNLSYIAHFLEENLQLFHFSLLKQFAKELVRLVLLIICSIMMTCNYPISRLVYFRIKGNKMNNMQDPLDILSRDDAVALRTFIQNGGSVNEVLVKPYTVTAPCQAYTGSMINLAAYYRATRCLLVLIEFGADLESRGEGKTPLLIACYNGDLEAVNILLLHGANVNATTQIGGPLHFVELCYSPISPEDRIQMIKNLIDYGADPNLRCRLSNMVPGTVTTEPEIRQVLRNYYQ